MAATSFLVLPIWSMIMFGGLVGLPLSVPPLPEDPALARVAPAECLWYLSAAGTADPDAESPNQTEQLLAEPEIRHLLAGLEDQIVRFAHLQAGSEEERILAAELPGLIKLGLTAPLAAYVADVQPNADGGPPTISAGLVVKAGDRADEFVRSIERLSSMAFGGPPVADAAEDWHEVRLPPGAPPVHWGARDGWLVLGIGEGEADHLADRLAGDSSPPEWLAKARSELPVDRRSTLGYLNVAGILERVRPTMGPEDLRIGESLGMNSIEALYTTSGMDEVACVTKGLLALNGPPRGIFALLPQEPLSRRDLQVVPQDAAVAVALRLDARATLDRFLDLVGNVQPRARQEMEEGLWQAETELGIDVRNDLLGPLDDSLTMYMPSGQLFTTWTGTSAVIKIKDRRRLERTLDKLAVVARMELGRGGGPEGVRFRESEFGEYTLHYLQFVGQPIPITPSWCVTEEHLVAGLTPQAVKTAVARLGNDGESIADVDAVADALAGDTGPALLAYVDTQEIVRGMYPVMTWGLQALAGEMSREGFEFDVALLPSVETIAPHLVPSVSTWRLSPEGFRFEAHQSLPGGDLVSSTPIAVAMLLPAVTSARGAARQTQEMNNLRQLSLAALNHEDAYGTYPADIYDDEGKPLLSWRVKVLPFIEEPALYEQFRLDEPWDSPHNRQLLEQMPEIFRSPSSSLPEGHTRFVALAHEDSLFPGKDAVKIGQVTDGTVNTLLFVQAAPEAAVEWTRPADIPFDAENPKQGLMQPGGRFLAAFADGSVQRISLDIADETLRRLVLRNDGQPIDRDEIGR